MNLENRQKPLPVWGYIVLNIIVLAVLVAIHLASVWWGRKNNYGTIGLFPVLLTCYVAFTVVSILDALFDRFTYRNQPGPRPTADKSPASGSKDSTRKTE